MRTTRRAVLGAAVTLGLAGCTGGSGDGDAGGGDSTTTAQTGDDETTDPTATATETTQSTDVVTATVRVRSHDDHGEILVGPDGMTLYMFDRDEQGSGTSTCTGDCAAAWPPLTVEEAPTSGSDVTAELTTLERDDGSRQVTVGGWPLYYFASDEEPGDVKGQGVNDVWWVLRPDGTPVRPDSAGGGSATVQVRSHDELGDILVGPEEMTLYMFDTDTRGDGTSACSGDCADAWPPLTVDGTPAPGENVTAELEIFEREDGGAQVTAGGWPLYYFASDEDSGDVKGQGAGDVWWVLRPDGAPVRSATATATATPTDEEDDDSGGGGGGGGGGYGAVRRSDSRR